MDDDGNLYVVNENGGGDANHPQLWVYAPSADTEPGPDRGDAHQPDDLDAGEQQHRGAGQGRRRRRSPTPTASAKTT